MRLWYLYVQISEAFKGGILAPNGESISEA